jgi:superfamily II DNA/RNA helicase
VEDYVHRIGRTGRAGASGFAFSLFSRKNMAIAPELIQVLQISLIYLQVLKSAGQTVPDKLYDFC